MQFIVFTGVSSVSRRDGENPQSIRARFSSTRQGRDAKGIPQKIQQQKQYNVKNKTNIKQFC